MLTLLAASYFGHVDVAVMLLLTGANPDLRSQTLDKLTPKEEATGAVRSQDSVTSLRNLPLETDFVFIPHVSPFPVYYDVQVV